MTDEEITLEWSVENARKVKLDGIEVADKDNYILSVHDNRTFELTASNWAGKEVQTLAVFLLTPVVLKFEADSPTIREGEPVSLHFQLQNAAFWKISAEYSSAFGNRRETIMEEGIKNPSRFFSKSVSLTVKGACTLSLITKNGFEKGLAETIRLSVRHLFLDMYTDRAVAKNGSFVHITWETQNANKIFLNPGNVDVTNMDYYDFLVEGDRDIQLELKAFGDFGQQATVSKALYLARINYISSSNNGDASYPVFYLNWSATGLQKLKLLPHDIPVYESEARFKIVESTAPVTYTLSGETSDQEEVSASITLTPCSIQYFLLEKGKVIIGSVATLAWLIKDARRVQLKFSDSVAVIDVPLSESKYSFQVFEGKDKVKLFAWGDTNMVEQEIPIPSFESPRILALKIPALNFHLEINWVASPIIKSAAKASMLYSIINSSSASGRSLYYRLARLLSAPSTILLNIMFLSRTSQLKKRMLSKSFPVHRLSSILSESVLASFDKNLKIQSHEGNQ